MTTSRDLERSLRAYLDEGPSVLPDRSYDVVRADIDRTRQRVVIGPWREPRMSNLPRIAIAAAAVLAVVIVGYNVLPGGGGTGGPGPSPSPTVSPTATPQPTAAPEATGPISLPLGPVAAGTYVVHPFLAPNDSIGFQLTLPPGWEAGGPTGRAPVGAAPTTGHEGPGGMSFGFLTIASLEGDPCRWYEPADIEIGPAVDDLVTALAANPGYETTAPVDVALGGFSGTRIDVQLPAGLDLAACDAGEFHVWADGDGQTIYAQGPEGRFHLWILDVRGTTVVVMTHDFPGTPADDQAELQAIVDSIQIQP
ncbi:MAG TPA: hypothetical protein VFX65_02045 [Candidatus Limnocylindrales bacterium]|nr:hypothetical protein [Candidatus Limnocylindrales bacterium]